MGLLGKPMGLRVRFWCSVPGSLWFSTALLEKFSELSHRVLEVPVGCTWEVPQARSNSA